MDGYYKKHRDEMKDEISKIKYDLNTFPLGDVTKKALENEISHRETFIKNLDKLFG